MPPSVGRGAVLEQEPRVAERGSLAIQLYLYPTETGGKKLPVYDLYRPLCFVEKNKADLAYGCMITVGQPPLAPGESRRVRITFPMYPDAAKILAAAEKFYIWDGGFVGEAVVTSAIEAKAAAESRI